MANQTTAYRMADGRMGLDIDSNKTLAASDCGVVQNVISDAITITLPATVVGYNFTIRNGGVKPTGTPTGAVSDASALLTVAPNSVDQIQGATFTAADNKAALNTKATARVSDEIRLVGDGVNGYMVELLKGVWARQA